LKKFSSETTFMSLPGYLRYLVHELKGESPTDAEAVGWQPSRTGDSGRLVLRIAVDYHDIHVADMVERR
jgi:hypothetical protein